jgi:hypothetical protein
MPVLSKAVLAMLRKDKRMQCATQPVLTADIMMATKK